MKAKLTRDCTGHEQANTVSQNRKEKHFTMQMTLVTRDLRDIAQLRIYNTPAAAYACLWLNDSAKGYHLSAGAKAGGGGYHRASAATGSAMRKCGVELSDCIDGRGEDAMREALLAIGRALGYRKVAVFTAHA